MYIQENTSHPQKRMTFAKILVDLEHIMPGEISYAEKDKRCISLIHGVEKTVMNITVMNIKQS